MNGHCRRHRREDHFPPGYIRVFLGDKESKSPVSEKAKPSVGDDFLRLGRVHQFCGGCGGWFAASRASRRIICLQGRGEYRPGYRPHQSRTDPGQPLAIVEVLQSRLS